MVIRLPDGSSTAIDYRETAPAAATRDMYLDAAGKPTLDSRVGPRAAGIPGVVRGLEYAHRKYGKLPWHELVKPAIALARDGVELDAFHADEMAKVTRTMADYAAKVPDANAALRAAMTATLRHLPQERRHDLREGRHVAAARSRRHARGDRRRRRGRVLPRPARPDAGDARGCDGRHLDRGRSRRLQGHRARADPLLVPRTRHHHDGPALGRRHHHCARSLPRRTPCTSSGSTGTRWTASISTSKRCGASSPTARSSSAIPASSRFR